MNEQKPSIPPPPPEQPMTGRQAYNVASDTITGVNIRWKDNVFQGVAIVVCLVAGVLIGWLVAEQRTAGAMIGGIAGLLAGLLGSGLFLMIFRAVQHSRGRHD